MKPSPTNTPPMGLSAVPLPKKARKTCAAELSDGSAAATAAALGAATALGPEPPALIALAVGRAAPTATREAEPATDRDTAAAGRAPEAPTDATGA